MPSSKALFSYLAARTGPYLYVVQNECAFIVALEVPPENEQICATGNAVLNDLKQPVRFECRRCFSFRTPEEETSASLLAAPNCAHRSLIRSSRLDGGITDCATRTLAQ
jgi:hypothetical protein